MAFESAAPKVQVTLADGKARGLFFSYRALREIREEFGISFNKRETYAKLDEEILPKVLLKGLIPLKDEKPFDRDTIEELMDGEQTNEYFAHCIRAANGSDIMEAVVDAKNVKSSLAKAAEPETEAKPTQGLPN